MKFSIVTPAWNSARFIGETIASVVTQRGDFEIEYLVLDNRSTDATAEIAGRWAKALAAGTLPVACRGVTMRVISEPDQGMYAAINRGFALAGGDAMAWINADDLYLPGAFSTMARVFGRFPEVQWAKGITSYVDVDSSLYMQGRPFLYQQQWLRGGLYGRECYFVQQDSVFWRPALWRAAGGIAAGLRRAGDYALWSAFAAHAPLVSVAASVSCFRSVPGQLSEDAGAYQAEMLRLQPGERAWAQAIGAQIRPDGSIAPGFDAARYAALFGAHEYLRIDLAPGREPHLRRGDFFALGGAA